jgi:3-isopropylmalate dehydrogenase
MIASTAMLLRHSLNLDTEADLVEQAILSAIAGGARTADLVRGGGKALSTRDMTSEIVKFLN